MKKNRPQSEKIFKRLCQAIPGGVNSPVRACTQMGQLPMVIEKASGDTLVDADGHSYIDFCGSWGALILGHSHPQVLQAVQERMMKGTTFGITTAIEADLAHEVIKLIPSIEKIRFVSSGTEATMSVARLARGFTKKDLIIKFTGNYHGHADFFLVQAGSGVMQLSPTSSSAGIPNDIVKNTISIPFNDIEACLQAFEENKGHVAAVILEPIAANMGVVPATHEFIHFLREETKKREILLILDEVITGFRVGLKGAQDYYGIQPDLTCFGKIVGGGLPAAAFGGRADIMDFMAPLGPVYQAGTLSGNPLAMEAGLKTLKLIQRPGFYENLQVKTDFLLKPIEELIKEEKIPACVQRVGSMFTLFLGTRQVKDGNEAKQLDVNLFADFFRYMFDNGVYVPPWPQEAWFISEAHQEQNLIKTRQLILDYLMNK